MSLLWVYCVTFLFIIVEGSVFKSDILCEYPPCLNTKLDKPAADHAEHKAPSPQASEHNKQYKNPAYNGKANKIHIEISKIVDGKDNGILNVRNRRSSPALSKLLKLLFVKSTNKPIEDDNEVAGTTQTSLPRERQANDNEEKHDEELTHLIYKLNVTLHKLEDKLLELSQYENEHGFLLIQIPVDFNHVASYRVSRDVTDKTENVKSALDNATATEVAGGDNDSQGIANVTHKMDSALKDVQNQISTIKRLKDHVTSEKTFKVGSVVASLETLELTLKKLISRMNSMSDLYTAWAKKILLKDQLSNLAVSNLMDYLRMYNEPNDYENKF